jgi:hypothetical protein
MLFNAEHFVFVPVSVLAVTAVVAWVVTALVELRARRAPAAVRQFRPVLVHDRSRQTLLRSRGMSRTARPKIRLVYNGG